MPTVEERETRSTHRRVRNAPESRLGADCEHQASGGDGDTQSSAPLAQFEERSGTASREHKEDGQQRKQVALVRVAIGVRPAERQQGQGRAHNQGRERVSPPGPPHPRCAEREDRGVAARELEQVGQSEVQSRQDIETHLRRDAVGQQVVEVGPAEEQEGAEGNREHEHAGRREAARPAQQDQPGEEDENPLRAEQRESEQRDGCSPVHGGWRGGEEEAEGEQQRQAGDEGLESRCDVKADAGSEREGPCRQQGQPAFLHQQPGRPEHRDHRRYGGQEGQEDRSWRDARAQPTGEAQHGDPERVGETLHGIRCWREPESVAGRQGPGVAEGDVGVVDRQRRVRRRRQPADDHDAARSEQEESDHDGAPIPGPQFHDIAFRSRLLPGKEISSATGASRFFTVGPRAPARFAVRFRDGV